MSASAVRILPVVILESERSRKELRFSECGWIWMRELCRRMADARPRDNQCPSAKCFHTQNQTNHVFSFEFAAHEYCHALGSTWLINSTGGEYQ